MVDERLWIRPRRASLVDTQAEVVDLIHSTDEEMSHSEFAGINERISCVEYSLNRLSDTILEDKSKDEQITDFYEEVRLLEDTAANNRRSIRMKTLEIERLKEEVDQLRVRNAELERSSAELQLGVLEVNRLREEVMNLRTSHGIEMERLTMQNEHLVLTNHALEEEVDILQAAVDLAEIPPLLDQTYVYTTRIDEGLERDSTFKNCVDDLESRRSVVELGLDIPITLLDLMKLRAVAYAVYPAEAEKVHKLLYEKGRGFIHAKMVELGIVNAQVRIELVKQE